MDFDALAAGMASAIPYNQHLGLEIAELAHSRAVVRLPDSQTLRNHVGSQHAGALFSAGEAASGGAFVASFAERLGDITPLAESAEITYKKIAKGPIDAVARLDADRDALLEQLDADGRVRFTVEVALQDGDGDVVAEMTVRWYVRRKDA